MVCLGQVWGALGLWGWSEESQAPWEPPAPPRTMPCLLQPLAGTPLALFFFFFFFFDFLKSY